MIPSGLYLGLGLFRWGFLNYGPGPGPTPSWSMDFSNVGNSGNAAVLSSFVG